jgi:MerR family transcriptional regulator, copper efflux regulator
MRDTLAHLAEHCHGDQRPECPILADLASDHETHCAQKIAPRRGKGR